MKLLSIDRSVSKYVIGIEIEFDLIDPIAAARINQLKNVSKRNLYTEDQLQRFNDVIDSIMNEIYSRGFHVLKNIKVTEAMHTTYSSTL